MMTRITEPTATRGPGPSHSPPDVRYAPTIGTARGLGWFSIGLGLAELLAPRLMGDLTGVRSPTLLQLYGLREIAAGVGILTSQRPACWMWGRVAGDALDLATLGAAAVGGDADDATRALVAGAAVAGVTALDVSCATALTAAETMEG